MDWERNVLEWREGEGWCIALPFERPARERTSSSPRVESEGARERPVRAVAASTKELKLGSEEESGGPPDVPVEGRDDRTAE